MKRLKNFVSKNKHFLYLLIFIPLLLVFYICQKYVTPRYIMHCKYDDCIPFVKSFIIAYMFWFFYMAIAFVYFGLKSKDDFIKLTKFIFWGMGISYAIFILLPTGQNMRPVLNDKDVFSSLVGFIYSIDPPANVCPSIHVINSIAVNSVVCNSPLFYQNKRMKILSSIAMVLICVSTLFVKQHSLIDVIAGTGLSIILYFCIYTVPKIKLFKYNNQFNE